MKYVDTTFGISGSISQITMRSTPGCVTNDPAVTPAPKPTTSTLLGVFVISADKWPSMRCSRMSCGRLDASTLPATWKFRTPVDSSDTAIDEFIPSPTYKYFGSVVYVGRKRPYATRPSGTFGTVATHAIAATAPATASSAAAGCSPPGFRSPRSAD